MEEGSGLRTRNTASSAKMKPNKMITTQPAAYMHGKASVFALGQSQVVSLHNAPACHIQLQRYRQCKLLSYVSFVIYIW